MKKLLLLSLLTLSATTFADVFQGETDHITVPIKISGEVIDTANTNLVIETDKTTGVEGGSIVFDFGKINKDTQTTISRSSNFKVRKGNNNAFDPSSENVKVGMLTSSGIASTAETTGTVVDVLGSSGKIVYTVASDADLANKKPTTGVKVINGTLKVDVVVASGAKIGQLLDSSQRLVAYLAAE